MKTLKYFSATWCGPCKAFKPVMNEIASEGHLVEFIDIDRSQDVASKYGIRSVPTVIIEQGGQEVDRFSGALPKQLVLEKIT
jgi:thioredoxin-like negative regulator of GroEL|tara:strand:- start:4588 stop:4833 length:246 start_codon:yes stop_codon:yes gene_type:complete